MSRRLKRAAGLALAGVALGAGANFGGCGAAPCSGKNSCSPQVGSRTTIKSGGNVGGEGSMDGLQLFDEMVEQIAKGERRRVGK